jgi:hypothetical protein
VTVIVTVVGVVVAPRGTPVTITLYEPAATEDATLIVRTLDPPVEDGVTEGGLNDVQETPEGGGVTHDSVTDCPVPDFRVAVIVTVPELPC